MDPSPQSSPPSRKRIFLSYGHDESVPLVLRLKNDLVARGYDVWFDLERIELGVDWEQYIEDGLARVSAAGKNGLFLLLMTPYSVRRPDGFCLNELARAIQLNLKVIPIMLVQCEPPLSICRIQWLDMEGCLPLVEREDRYRQKFERLLEAIENDRIDFEGFHSHVVNVLKPISFDAEISYNLKRFSGRSWVLDEVQAWLADHGASRIFWLTGAPGVGKTVISAWLCTTLLEVRGFHFCSYGNVTKTDTRRCIMSMAYQLSTQLPEYEERLKRLKLDDLESLNPRSLFDHLIVQPLSSNYPRPARPVVILIDALDEATMAGKNEFASFIATEFERAPEWLKLIVTSRPDPEVTGYLQAYHPFSLNISDPRNNRDIREFLRRELGKYYPGKAVPAAVVESIVKKSDGLFLYVEWILRSLDQGGLSLDRLEEFPRGLGGIYLKFFERQFPDVGLWESAIRPPLEVLLAVQEPVPMKMLSEIFGWNPHDERKFRRSLGSIFTVEGGVITPFHRSVVEWLTDEEKQDIFYTSISEGHKILAAYGWGQYQRGVDGVSPYMARYLPLHLYSAGRSADLRALLRDLRFIRKAWETDRFSIMEQWTRIEATSSIRMADIYQPVLLSPQKEDDKDLEAILEMFRNTYHFDEALRLLDYLIDHYRGQGDRDRLQRCLSYRAWIAIDRSDYDLAMGLLKEQEGICRETNNQDGLQFSLLKQAEILWHRSDFDTAMGMLKEQERICREIGSLHDLPESLNCQSLILRVHGDTEGAMKLLKEQERICRETGNIDSLQAAMGDQGNILRVRGDLGGALTLLREQEQLSRKVNNKDYLGISLVNQAIIYMWQGDLEAAMGLLKESEQISHGFGNMFGISESLIWQITVLVKTGDLDGALTLIKDTRRICLENGDDYIFQYIRGQEGIVYRLQGDIDRAVSLHTEQATICRKIGHRRELAVSLNYLAVDQRMKGRIDDAVELHGQAEAMLREIGYAYGLQECLGDKAMTLFAKGDADTALGALKEQEKICRDMGLKLDLEKCLANRNDIVDSQYKA